MQPDPPPGTQSADFQLMKTPSSASRSRELARKNLSDLPPGEEKPGNHDDQGDHNQAEQNPQTTTAARRWPRMRQEIAHTMFVLPTMRDRAKRLDEKLLPKQTTSVCRWTL